MAQNELDELITGFEAQLDAISLASTLTNEDIRKAQLKDVDIGFILRWKEEKDERPQWKDVSSLSSSIKTYWVNWNLLEVRNGVLCKRWESNDGNTIDYKIVLPRQLRSIVLSELHDSKTAAHCGVNKTLHKVQTRYYWVG